MSSTASAEDTGEPTPLYEATLKTQPSPFRSERNEDEKNSQRSPFLSLLLVLALSALTSGILLYQTLHGLMNSSLINSSLINSSLINSGLNADGQTLLNTPETFFFTAIGTLGFLLSLPVGWTILRLTENKLRALHGDLSLSESRFSKQASSLGDISQRLSSGATEAASSLQETAASIEELSSMVKLNADHAREASALSINSRQAAEEGERRMQGLHQVMREISASSKKIEDIIDLIDDIAFQTNLLALNAAVEAARAGDNGKGFAVVAEAVRTLAQKSASAAKEISTLIRSSAAQVERGVESADLNEAALREILISVKKVADLNDEIAGASREQAGGIEQISKAINQLDQATQLNAASAEQAAATANELNYQSMDLRQFVLRLQGFIQSTSTAKQTAYPSRKVSVKRVVKREPLLEGPTPSRGSKIADIISIDRSSDRTPSRRTKSSGQMPPNATPSATLPAQSRRPRDEDLIPFEEASSEKKKNETPSNFDDLSGF